MTRISYSNGDYDNFRSKGAYANVNNVVDTYTLTVADAGGLVIGTKGTGFTITIPKDTFVAGDKLDIMQGGAGAVTIAAGSGATLHEDATYTAVTDGQYSVAQVICTATNVFVVRGDVVAA